VHKALADEAVAIWEFLNENFSLMMDSALSSVWGKYAIRQDILENPEEFSQGVPQGAVFLLRANTPEGMKAVEAIDSRNPGFPDGMEMFNTASRESKWQWHPMT